MLNTIKGAIFGHAIGDALGVPVEFCTKDELEVKPVSDMEGHGTHDVPAGTWSDDTSMVLATLDSLTGTLDYKDIMNKFAQWLGEGRYTANGEVFDVGNSTRKAILLYAAGDISPTECGQNSEWDNGNGSLMRMLPFVLYLYYRKLENPLDIIADASRLTHSHERSIVGCGIYALILWEILCEKSHEAVYKGLSKACEIYGDNEEFANYSRLFELDFAALPVGKINSSGYIVDTLEAAVWCFLNSESYSECVLKAVNLGEDTDTVAAVAGGMAGALYGYNNLPSKWINKLARNEYIEQLCIKACGRWYK